MLLCYVTNVTFCLAENEKLWGPKTQRKLKIEKQNFDNP